VEAKCRYDFSMHQTTRREGGRARAKQWAHHKRGRHYPLGRGVGYLKNEPFLCPS